MGGDFAVKMVFRVKPLPLKTDKDNYRSQAGQQQYKNKRKIENLVIVKRKEEFFRMVVLIDKALQIDVFGGQSEHLVDF